MGLVSKLTDAGLDATYWKVVLFQNFGISQLKQLTSDHFETLKGLCRSYLEVLTFISLLDNINHQGSSNLLTVSSNNEIESLPNLLKVFGLSEHFPSKISLKDVISITKNQLETEAISEISEVPWIMLQRFVRIDFKGRDEVLNDYMSIQSEPNRQKEPNANVREDENGEGSEEYDDNPFGDPSYAICAREVFNPLDVFLSVFYCCDPMLKQVLVEKMFICKLAVPFVYKDPLSGTPLLSLWPLRAITLELKPSEGKASEISVVMDAIRICAFIRIGRPKFSKSQIMNEILNENTHHTFFNKDCPLGMSDRCISYGFIEASWFVPSKKSNEIFKEPMTFINLRGDATFYKRQVNIIRFCSNIVVAAIDMQTFGETSQSNFIRETLKSDTPSILILCTSPEEFQKDGKVWEMFSQQVPFNRKTHAVIATVDKQTKKEKNSVEIRNEIRKKIISFQSIKIEKNLEDVAKDCALKGLLTSDEQTKGCIKGWSHVTNIMREIDTMDCNVKDHIVPLQGDTWCKWTELQKKKFKSGAKIPRMDINYLTLAMKKVRIQQRDKTTAMSRAMLIFLKTLTNNIDNSEFIQFFIGWLKFYLDNRSRRIIPQLRHRYNMLWMENIKSGKSKSKELTEKTNQAETALVNASFGLEHMVRELGQMYEAFISCKKKRSSIYHRLIAKLPETVANFLLLGYPFEIMDGDAANVPMDWLKAVFTCLQRKLCGKKTLSISVLGIQSSGKSTLLNTMFGLQFAVSAGRCTRGIFMQLIRVEMASNLPYEYIIVVDTEGLRAPELSTKNYDYDNELATLVIGMADITIVNVKGENTAEVEDVLQIVVHAFLRMTLANRRLDLHRSCVFLHQNVAAVNAESKMQHAVHKLVEKLNEMTREAALQENIENIQLFNEVINFDVDRHVWYFSDMWHGDPPMAPSNPGYSYNVKQVRTCILRDLATKKGTFLTIDETLEHVVDLWKGILTDDFVFSFRNSLEVKAYNSLEIMFQKLTWQFEERVRKWIENCVDQKMKYCQTFNQLTENYGALISDLKRECNEIATDLHKKLDSFFKNSDLKDILEQWHQNRKYKLRDKFYDIQSRYEKEIREKKDQNSIILQRKSTQTNLERKINKRAKDLAEKFRGENPSNEKLQEKFNEVWEPWISDITVDSSKTHESIESQTQKALDDCVVDSEQQSVTQELEKCALLEKPDIVHLKGSISIEDIEKNHLQINKRFNIGIIQILDKCSFQTCAKHAVANINVFLAAVDVKIKAITDCDQRFNPSFVRELLEQFFEDIKKHNDDITIIYKILPSLKVKVATHICRYSLHCFTQMDTRYQNKHSVKAKIQEYKEFAETLFIDAVRNKTEEVKAANFLSKQFESLIAEEVKRIIPSRIEGEITGRFATKFYLIVQVMDDLLNKDSFEEFLLYIRSENDFVQKWIKEYTIKTIIQDKGPDGKTQYESWAEGIITSLICFIKAKLNEATKETGENGIECWLRILESKLKDKIPLTMEAFCHVSQFDKVKDLRNLEDSLEGKLMEIEENIRRKFAKLTLSDIYSGNNSLNENIFKRIWGCTAHCPFCFEPCQRAMDNHTQEDHSCIQHRPEAIKGWRSTKTNVLQIDDCGYNIHQKQIYLCGPTCKSGDKEKCNLNPEDKQSHPYENYREFFPDWTIEPTAEPESNKYWMWFIAKYPKQLAQFYNAEPPDVPESWYEIAQQEAKDSLRTMYKIKLV